jgi:hypothetical protein
VVVIAERTKQWHACADDSAKGALDPQLLGLVERASPPEEIADDPYALQGSGTKPARDGVGGFRSGCWAMPRVAQDGES